MKTPPKRMKPALCPKTGKHRHRTRKAAQDHIKAIRATKGRYRGNPYFCEHCQAWHVGRKRLYR